mmetsp:Transcript_5596/g.17026  ORF Transcript_5596/g.17026 Transcript_5596/m.17026 type:complete len:261 (-) Transcript_5596:581-1363(-)
MAMPAPLAAPKTPLYRLAMPGMILAAPEGGTSVPIFETPPEPRALPKVPACIWTFTVSRGWMVLWLAARASAPATVSAKGLALLLPSASTSLATATRSAGSATAFLATTLFLVARAAAILLRPRASLCRIPEPPPFLAEISKPPLRLRVRPALGSRAASHVKPFDAFTHLILNVASVILVFFFSSSSSSLQRVCVRCVFVSVQCSLCRRLSGWLGLPRMALEFPCLVWKLPAESSREAVCSNSSGCHSRCSLVSAPRASP